MDWFYWSAAGAPGATIWVGFQNDRVTVKDSVGPWDISHETTLDKLRLASPALIRRPGIIEAITAMESTTNEERSFIEAMLATPDDESLRLVFTDWLEERGDPRAELLRLTHTLTKSIELPNRPELEDRMRMLLKEGVQPIGPFWTNSLGMRFAWIPAGKFLMGSPQEEKEREENEAQHRVTLSKGFFMGAHLVTQEQWQAVMSGNPSRFKGEKNLPVDAVSWDDCQEFIKRLHDTDKKPYRLPFEAEWEYACRAGTTTPFFFGATISTDQANYCGNYTYDNGKQGVHRQKTTPVGSFPPNAWGLFDAHGNLLEWCQDSREDYPQNEIAEPHEGKRFLRGGSWINWPQHCRSAYRDWHGPGYLFSNYGLRICFFAE